MNGREILKAIRSDAKLCHLLITILTTSRSEQDINDSYRLGANCYVIKPISMGEFIELISDLQNFWFKTAQLPTE